MLTWNNLGVAVEVVLLLPLEQPVDMLSALRHVREDLILAIPTLNSAGIFLLRDRTANSERGMPCYSRFKWGFSFTHLMLMSSTKGGSAIEAVVGRGAGTGSAVGVGLAGSIILEIRQYKSSKRGLLTNVQVSLFEFQTGKIGYAFYPLAFTT